MFHAYFTRAYRRAPQHFRHVGTSGMLTHKQRHSACSLFGGPFHARPGLLFRTRPPSSARKPAIPSLGNPAHVRNRRPTRETDGPHAKQTAHTRSFRGGGLRKIGSWAGLQIRVPTRIRIGNEHADRLLTYPHGHNLSACARLCSGPGRGGKRGGVDRASVGVQAKRYCLGHRSCSVPTY